MATDPTTTAINPDGGEYYTIEELIQLRSALDLIAAPTTELTTAKANLSNCIATIINDIIKD